MPFATTYNYNWLFDASSLNEAFKSSEALFSNSLSSFVDLPDMWTQPQSQLSPGQQQQQQQFLRLPDPFASNDELMLLQSESERHRSSASLDPTVPHQTADQPAPYNQQQQQDQPTEFDWMVPSVPLEPPKPALPLISEEVRAGMLELVAQAHPTAMDGLPIDQSSPLLSLAALQNYCDLFFTRFNTSYPIIHRPTFDADRVERPLLAAIISLGATYSSRDAHRLAVAVHDILRNVVFSHAGFTGNPELWVLQTLVLIDCFGKSRAGQRQRDMAQLFHCVLIKLIRRSDCTTIRTAPAKPELAMGQEGREAADLETEWRHAMDAEQRKRLAMMCFIWDTQHATLFSQSLCMSAFEIRCSLACDASTWEASTAQEWHQSSQHEHPQSHQLFLHVLRAYISPTHRHAQRPRHLNALSRMLLLHGLMSIGSDLKRRDQTALRIESPDLVGAWKTRMALSLDLWKADFDADCMSTKLNVLSDMDMRSFTGHKTSAYALFHAAHITLNVEVLDLQIFAGASHILGRAVTKADVERSRRVVTRWVNEDFRSAAKVARHSSLVLRDAVMNLHDWDDNDAFHYPWCLYLATLGCWAFHLPTSTSSALAVTGGNNSNNNSNGNNNNNNGRGKPTNGGVQNTTTTTRPLTDEEAKNQMTGLLVGMTTCSSLEELCGMSGKFSTSGLTSVMAKQLAKVRWGIIHDSMKVLMNLSTNMNAV